jgi:hypothetical protein
MKQKRRPAGRRDGGKNQHAQTPSSRHRASRQDRRVERRLADLYRWRGRLTLRGWL